MHHTCSTNPIWNPFTNIDESEVNLDNRGILLVIDDLMTEAWHSSLVSDIFSKGRHLNVSVILILQSYFPQSSTKRLMPQIKDNRCVQILFKLRVMVLIMMLMIWILVIPKNVFPYVLMTLYAKIASNKKTNFYFTERNQYNYVVMQILSSLQ